MATDKKDYQAVLNALLDHSTLAALINKLNKVWVATEDSSLKKALGSVIGPLKLASLNQTKKSQVLSLNIKDPSYQPLFEYCQQCLASIKPQWQIIAEQHGWGPKS